MNKSKLPVAKVTAAGLGGALATLVVFGAQLFGYEVPGEVGAALATIFAFAAGWLKAA